MKKRISAFLLSVVLCLTMVCPTLAQAAGSGAKLTVEVTDAGDIVVSTTEIASGYQRVPCEVYWTLSGNGQTFRGNVELLPQSDNSYAGTWRGGAIVAGTTHLNPAEDKLYVRALGGGSLILGEGYWPESQPPVELTVEMEPKTLSLKVNGTATEATGTLTATIEPANADCTIAWTSAPEGYVTITQSEDGKTATVTATKASEKPVIVTVTVTPKGDGEAVSATATVTITDAGTTPGHEHKASDTWTSDKTGHWHKCIAEGCDEPNVQLDLAAHTYGGEDGITCTVCGYKHTHTYSNWVTTDANVHWRTCEDLDCPKKGQRLDEGAHNYVSGVCTVCGKKESPTPTHTHSWSSAWNTDADYHWHECSNPNCPITANSGKNGYAAHSWNDGVVTVEATLYLDGVRTYTCTVCGYEKTEVIPALGGSIGGGSSTIARPGQSGGNTASSGSNVSVVVNRPSSGSTGGTVTISDPNAKPGSKVDVTVTPKKGYALESITVKDSSGKAVTLTNNGNGVYSFTMPEGKVSVDYSFTRTTAKPEVIRGEATFTDVKSDAWYSEAVQYAYQHGIMNGIGNNEFSPETNLTRAMIVQVLYNLEGTPKAPSGDFADVAAGAWYANPVNWAAANGIVNGYGNGNFGPEDDITREQMAAILYRYAEYKGYDVTKRGELDQFSDVALVSSWATEAMEWAVGVGLITGTDKGELGPTGTATRAQVATVMMRFCENIMD